jgi:hypothetical protein
VVETDGKYAHEVDCKIWQAVRAEGLLDNPASAVSDDSQSLLADNLGETSIVGPLDAIWHVMNLFAPAVGLAMLATAGAKLLWRRELASVSWRRLAIPAALACALVLLAGLVLLGRDGKMATYGAMVAAAAVTLWWRGFGPGRR